MRMKLLTKKNLKNLPPLDTYANNLSNRPEIPVPVRYFTPWSNWTWYAIEYDPVTRMFFGLVDGTEVELGYFSLDELEEVNGPFGLYIERDRCWEGKTLEDAYAALK